MLIFFFGLTFLVQNKEVLDKDLPLKLDLYLNVNKLPFLGSQNATVAADEAVTAPETANQMSEAARKDEKGRLQWNTSGVPVFFVIICSFILGMLFAACFFLTSRIRMGYAMVGRKREVRQLRKQLEKCKTEKAHMVLDTDALDASKQLSGNSGKEEAPQAG